MSDFWNTVGAQAEGDKMEQLVEAALIEAAPYKSIVTGAKGKEDFANRVQIVNDRLDAAIAKVIDPTEAEFHKVKASVLGSFRAAFEQNHRYELHEATLKAKRQFALQQEAMAELTKQAEIESYTHDNGVVELDYDDESELYDMPGVAICGVCGRAWVDTISTSVTPVPSGRCPFEYEHGEMGEFTPWESSRKTAEAKSDPFWMFAEPSGDYIKTVCRSCMDDYDAYEYAASPVDAEDLDESVCEDCGAHLEARTASRKTAGWWWSGSEGNELWWGDAPADIVDDAIQAFVEGRSGVTEREVIDHLLDSRSLRAAIDDAFTESGVARATDLEFENGIGFSTYPGFLQENFGRYMASRKKANWQVMGLENELYYYLDNGCYAQVTDLWELTGVEDPDSFRWAWTVFDEFGEEIEFGMNDEMNDAMVDAEEGLRRIAKKVTKKARKAKGAPKKSPWGKVIGSNEIANGIYSVYAKQGGGILVTGKAAAYMKRVRPMYAQAALETKAGLWFDQDRNWAVVATMWPKVNPLGGMPPKSAAKMLPPLVARQYLSDIRSGGVKSKRGEK